MTDSFSTKSEFRSTLSPESSVSGTLCHSHLPSTIYQLTPVLLLLVLASVAFESTLAPSINNHLIPHLDKIAHFFVFGIIAWLIASVFFYRFGAVSPSQVTSYKVNGVATTPRTGEVERGRMLKPREDVLGYKSLSASFLLTAIAGGLNEYIQSFTPWRDVSLYDVVADLAGVILFLAAWKILQITNHKSQVTVSPYAP